MSILETAISLQTNRANVRKKLETFMLAPYNAPFYSTDYSQQTVFCILQQLNWSYWIFSNC